MSVPTVPTVVLFDSNETLLDLAALDSLFRRAYGDAAVRKQWFRQTLELCLTATIIDRYRDFDGLADAALDMAARQYGTRGGGDALANADRVAIHDGLLSLPVHPDVSPALERLRERGLRLAVLTNSTGKSARAQLARANVAQYFERIVSVDAIRRYKPAREAYELAARELEVETGGICMVAAHAWDIAGARAAGCRTAFVRRSEKALDPGAEPPDLVADDLFAIATLLLEHGT